MVEVIIIKGIVQHNYANLIQHYYYCIDFALQSKELEHVKQNAEVKVIVQKLVLICNAQVEETLQKNVFSLYNMTELVVISVATEKVINYVKGKTLTRIVIIIIISPITVTIRAKIKYFIFFG